MNVDELENGDKLVIREDIGEQYRHTFSQHDLSPGDEVYYAFSGMHGIMLKMGQAFPAHCFRRPQKEEKETYCTLTIRSL